VHAGESSTASAQQTTVAIFESRAVCRDVRARSVP
jgi:hypothetical protein